MKHKLTELLGSENLPVEIIPTKHYQANRKLKMSTVDMAYNLCVSEVKELAVEVNVEELIKIISGLKYFSHRNGWMRIITLPETQVKLAQDIASNKSILRIVK